MGGNRVVEDFGAGIVGKLKKKMALRFACPLHRREDGFSISFTCVPIITPIRLRFGWPGVYAGPASRWCWKFRLIPYDQEYRTLGLKEKRNWRSTVFTGALARQLRAVVTFSDLSSIFGQRAIRISNGVSFERIPVRREHDPVRGEVHLVAVADISFWHGFDRLVRGWRLIMLANSARPTCT